MIVWSLRKGGMKMDTFVFILKYLMHGSIIVRGALLIYWFE
ncbi:hypothetical protein [Halobacillus sp. GSS1]|nr:hypothetical protein [Halobacillus sp. GSS1]